MSATLWDFLSCWFIWFKNFDLCFLIAVAVLLVTDIHSTPGKIVHFLWKSSFYLRDWVSIPCHNGVNLHLSNFLLSLPLGISKNSSWSRKGFEMCPALWPDHSFSLNYRNLHSLFLWSFKFSPYRLKELL